VTTLETLRERYESVRDRVAAAARSAGRAPESIVLVAVSKYSGADQIRELINLGHRDFGENHAQQLTQRATMMAEWLQRQKGIIVPPVRTPAPGSPASIVAATGGIRWHMVGHLQRNKVRKVLEVTRLIHSVDTLRVGEEIQQAATRLEQTVDLLLQVNCSGEKSKFGCSIPAALHLAEQLDTMVGVRVRGLMTMAPHSDNPEDSRATFARCRDLFEEALKAGIGGPHLNILSMGMSGDFEVAISEGANMVRVGSTIFGPPAPGTEDAQAEDDGDVRD
jgi:pyridoxal phosphate enzyme (YggS family)